MDCASCNQTMKGCASVKCSLCSMQYHLDCATSEGLIGGNSWRCGKCENSNTSLPPVMKTGVPV